MKNLFITLVLSLSFVSPVLANDPYREFLACVDELLDNDPKMNPKHAEDICSDLLDGAGQKSLTEEEAKNILKGRDKYLMEVAPQNDTIILNSIALLDVIKDLKFEISNPSNELVYATSTAAVTSYSLWWLLRNPSMMLKLATKRAVPALAILPPEIVDQMLNPSRDKIILLGTEEQQKKLIELLSLKESEQLKILQADSEFADYLVRLRDSIETQRFMLLYKNGQAT